MAPLQEAACGSPVCARVYFGLETMVIAFSVESVSAFTFSANARNSSCGGRTGWAFGNMGLWLLANQGWTITQADVGFSFTKAWIVLIYPNQLVSLMCYEVKLSSINLNLSVISLYACYRKVTLDLLIIVLSCSRTVRKKYQTHILLASWET